MVMRNEPIIDFVFIRPYKVKNGVFIAVIAAVHHNDFTVFRNEHKPLGLIDLRFYLIERYAPEHIRLVVNVVRKSDFRQIYGYAFAVFNAYEHTFFAVPDVNGSVEQ